MLLPGNGVIQLFTTLEDGSGLEEHRRNEQNPPTQQTKKKKKNSCKENPAEMSALQLLKRS
jgi:hypothetical protein